MHKRKQKGRMKEGKKETKQRGRENKEMKEKNNEFHERNQICTQNVQQNPIQPHRI